VAVLVDEYDKPILDGIERPELATANRDCLRGFYGIIKGSARNVRFTFVTGVSMFSRVSLFSGLNNLRNISLDPSYAGICGYTDADLDEVFAPELEGLDRDRGEPVHLVGVAFSREDRNLTAVKAAPA